jgi:hypothetical protein
MRVQERLLGFVRVDAMLGDVPDIRVVPVKHTYTRL